MDRKPLDERYGDYAQIKVRGIDDREAMAAFAPFGQSGDERVSSRRSSRDPGLDADVVVHCRAFGWDILELVVHMQQGDLRPDLDVDTVIDTLYAPIYYRLLFDTGPMSDAFADGLYESVIEGYRASRDPQHAKRAEK